MKQLSNSELEIMIKLWDAATPMSFEEIYKAVEERNWEESTVRSFIQRMMTKGFIQSEADGRKRLYSPKVSRDYIDRQSQNLISRLYDDSVQNFIAGLYQNNALSKQDLQELKTFLEEILEEN